MNEREWINETPTEFLMCRDSGIRHKWEPVSVRRDTKSSGYVETIACERCGTEKDRYLDRDGSPRKVKFDYAAGYLRPSGEGRITKSEHAEIRLASLKRRYKGIR